MAVLLRGLRVGRALRCLSRVTVPVGSGPQCCAGGRGFHRAALLLQDESKSDQTASSSSSSSSYHQHYQAHPSESEPAASASEEDSPKPNDSYEDLNGEENGEYETEEQLQVRILTAAVEFVPQHSWSVEAISAGAESLGLSSSAAGMFTNGAGDLILHFIAQCNAQLTQSLSDEHNQVQMGLAEPKETAEFLKDAIEARLRMITPYIDTWPQAMSILLLPHNIPDSLKHLSTLIDDIWYYAGDRSTDVSASSEPKPSSSSAFIFSPVHQHLHSVRPGSAKLNWYTRRAALTGIYNTTELVMLQDSSPEFQDTWTFLDNRIQDMMNMADTAKKVQSTGEAVVQGLMGAAVTLKNLTGMNQRR